MAAKLESVSKSPTLKLAFKSLLLALAIFFLRTSSFSFLAGVLFFALFLIFYLRPGIGSDKFLASAVTLVFLVIKLPQRSSYEIYLAVLLGILFYLLLGVKNLAVVRRRDFYYILHFAEVIVIGFLFIKGIVNPLIAFLFFFFLFREFYLFFLNVHPRKIWLMGATEAVALVEVLWIISFLPLDSLSGASLAAVLIFIFHDLSLHHLEGPLLREIVLRGVTIIIFFTILILGTSKWTL